MKERILFHILPTAKYFIIRKDYFIWRSHISFSLAPPPLLCYNTHRGDIMRKILSVLLVFVLSISLSGCALLNVKMEENIDSTENAQNFYDKVNESKVILDLVATDVCAAWKDASYDYAPNMSQSK